MKHFWRHLTVLIMAASISDYAQGAEVRDGTTCRAMVEAMDSENLVKIRPFTVYVLNTMDEIDTKHIQAGEPGIMAQLSEDGRYHLAAAALANCRHHPKMTVYNSAAFVYRGIREMELQFGTAK